MTGLPATTAVGNGSARRMQRWRKLGPVLRPDGQLQTRSMLPTPHRIGERRWRVYYGATDADMVSRIEYLEVDPAQPTQAVATSPRPALDIGTPGCFDDNGVVPGGLAERGDELYLYYTGFQKQTKIPYTMLSGLAASSDGGATFSRALSTPVLERSPSEPFFRIAGSLLRTAAGWRLWYIGGGEWVREGDRVLPSYSFLTASSTDGRHWPDHGEVCLSPAPDELGFGRPSVIHEEGSYRAWYSIRDRLGRYRLGYAESSDGVSWRRLDQLLDFGASLAGFDDEMMCYPGLLRHGADLYLYYSGNGYGRAGIGVAVLEQD